MDQGTSIAPQPIRYLPEKEVSSMTGFSLSKLQQDRFYRKGIPYIRLGRSIRYSIQDVLDYMNAHKINPEGGTA